MQDRRFHVCANCGEPALVGTVGHVDRPIRGIQTGYYRSPQRHHRIYNFQGKMFCGTSRRRGHDPIRQGSRTGHVLEKYFGQRIRSSREVAHSSTEKNQHGMAPTRYTSARDSPRTWTHPDTVLQEARRRVASLEAAPQAMGDFHGPEVDVLKNALLSPLKEQLAQNDAFIQRSQQRIASLEWERAEEQAFLDKVLVRQSSRRWPSWKRNESRVQSEGLATPRSIDKAQNRELSRGQFADKSTRSPSSCICEMPSMFTTWNQSVH